MGKKNDHGYESGRDLINMKTKYSYLRGDRENDTLKRYGINPGDYAEAGAISQGRTTKTQTYDDMLDELTRRANNDYDNRRMTEAAYMSGNKDAEKYAKGGIGSIKDLHDLQDLQKDWHKEAGNGGNFSSNSDYAGLTNYFVQKDRDVLNESIDSRIAAATPEEIASEAQEEEPIYESEQMRSARERTSNYMNDFDAGQHSEDIYGGGSTNEYGGFDPTNNQFDNSSKSKTEDNFDGAQNFLDKKRAEIKMKASF